MIRQYRTITSKYQYTLFRKSHYFTFGEMFGKNQEINQFQNQFLFLNYTTI